MVFADVIKNLEITLIIGQALNSMTSVFVRDRMQEDTDTEGRRPRGDRGRDWNEHLASDREIYYDSPL